MEDLLDKLRQYMKIGTPAERRIARYFSEHLSELPFETAASVAEKLGLSPMTVGRFLRALGYQGLDSIKVQMRQTTTAPTDLQDGPDTATPGETLVGEIVLSQIEALRGITHLATGPHWKEAATAVIAAREVFIISHRRIGCLVRRFYERIYRTRERVYFVEGQRGCLELLARMNVTDSLLILVDCSHFQHVRTLLRTARHAGYRVLLITWAQTDRQLPEANIMLPLAPPRGDSDQHMALLAAMLECLAAQISRNAGPDAIRQGLRIAELEGMFAESAVR